MKTNDEKTTPDNNALLESPKVEVDGKEFAPFESDGEFWAMLDAIEEESISKYEKNIQVSKRKGSKPHENH